MADEEDQGLGAHPEADCPQRQPHNNGRLSPTDRLDVSFPTQIAPPILPSEASAPYPSSNFHANPLQISMMPNLGTTSSSQGFHNRDGHWNGLSDNANDRKRTSHGHQRQGSMIPDLSIETKIAAGKTQSISPLSPMSKSPALKSPLSRDRRFSLRRSVLSGNVQGRNERSGSVIELESTEESLGETQITQLEGDRNGRQPEPAVAVSNILEQADGVNTHPQDLKNLNAFSSLPHYEAWVASESVKNGLLKYIRTLKDNIRKRILRIREIPPSKDGRHLELDPAEKAPFIDERTGRTYVSNVILSSRYTIYNFLPRQLYAQFSKLANFYFLCVSILQMIPGLSTTGTYTTITPLLFFISISIAKEGYDDIRRYRLDKAENNKTTSVLQWLTPSVTDVSDANGCTSDGALETWLEKKWADVKVGDIVKLKRDEAVPADLVILRTGGTDQVAYVDTMALDGETNLKSRYASRPLAESFNKTKDLARCCASFVIEDPNVDLYNFEGRVTVGGETHPLNNSEIIYRGSVLRNTSEVIGLVVYAGQECKIRMNAMKNPRIKAPALQTIVNKVVIMLVIFVLVLSIFNTVAYQIWRGTTGQDSWYLTNAGVSFFPILVSFIILFNTLIPLSLYVSLEIVKLFQMLLLSDVDMYDEKSNTPMEARTSTINEELGQINYIFSDKTGTLTNNSMRFRKMSVMGTAWLHDRDLQEEIVSENHRQAAFKRKPSKGKVPVMSRSSASYPQGGLVEKDFQTISTDPPIIRNNSTASRQRYSLGTHISDAYLNTVELLRLIERRPHTVFARKVRFFLLSMALCHTCIPETKDDGEIAYQAASPDEHALVRAARELGYIVMDRQNATITIKLLPLDGGEATLEEYKVLDVVEFTSNRKRMSVIVQMPNHRICVFCKGADSTLVQLLRLSGLATAKSIEIEQKANMRRSCEAQEAVRRASDIRSPKGSLTRKSISIHRPSLGGMPRESISTRGLRAIRDDVDHWLRDREIDVDMSPISGDHTNSERPSTNGVRYLQSDPEGRSSSQNDYNEECIQEASILHDDVVFERCFQDVNDFATEGLRTLLYGYRYVELDEYKAWKKIYLDASTSLVDRSQKIERAGDMIEKDLELAGVTAIEDKLQDGVPEAIDKLRRAGIKIWMLTGDKRETAVNVAHSCRLIKDYSSVTVLDQELDDLEQTIAAATLNINSGNIAHSVVVVDGRTLAQIMISDVLRSLFFSLAILADTVICCRASPSQKASLVHAIGQKDKNAITLAIGDGANDIAMIQEAHVGIGITGKEGLQAARSSDYSIAQFRFLTKLLLVHGRWNYLRTCRYTLGTFWKEMMFYITQALYQRFAGYTGTSLYESWSLSMFNTLFTSLPVIFMGVFEQDLCASTLLAVPELYHSLGHNNGGFKIKIYLAWVALAASQAVMIFFIMLGLYGQAIFTLDSGLYAMGDLTFTACIIVIATKMQFWELYNKTYTCAIAMFVSIGGWFLWNAILSARYTNNVIYNVKDGFFDRFGRNALWWLTLMLVVTSCWVLEVGVKVMKRSWAPSDADILRELQNDPQIKTRFEVAANVGLEAHISYGTDRHDHPVEIFRSMRTASEDRQREGEVQEMLDRPRHIRKTSGAECEFRDSTSVRKRQHSISEGKPKVSFAVDVNESIGGRGNGDDDASGKKRPRRSIDVHELLKRGFGSVRRSLDFA